MRELHVPHLRRSASVWTYCAICSLASSFRIYPFRFHLTQSPVINSRSWRWSNAFPQFRSVYQTANTGASWLVAKIPPNSNAGKFAEATPRAAAGRVILNATSARKSRVKLRTLVRALRDFLLFARIIEVIPANERSSAVTYVASIVPRIIRAIRNAFSHAGSSVATRNAQRIVGSLAHRV